MFIPTLIIEYAAIGPLNTLLAILLALLFCFVGLWLFPYFDHHASDWVRFAYFLIQLVIAVILLHITQLSGMIFFLPLPIVAYAWKWMYDPTIGVFTHIIEDVLGLTFPFNGWLIDPRLAMPSIAIMSVWQYSGWIMMLFLVGLNNIPNQLYEAARIDGSSAWKSFFRITLPLLKPTFFVVVIMRLAVLGITVEPLIMTEGGPGRSTMTYGLHAYYLAFRWGNWRMGYASAWYVMLALFATLLGVLAWKFLREESVYG